MRSVQLFARFDGARKGHLTVSEFKSLLRGFRISIDETDQLMNGIDVYRDGVVRSSEWAASMADWRELQKDEAWPTWLREAFEMINASKSGTISQDEVRDLLCRRYQDGECEVDMGEVDGALREAVSEGGGGRKGTLTFDIFQTMMKTRGEDYLFDARLRDEYDGW